MSGKKIVATLSRQLSWSHFKDVLKRKLHDVIARSRRTIENRSEDPNKENDQ